MTNDTRTPAAAGMIGVRGTTFRDESGRHVILRGVNLGGDTKVPVNPDGHTYRETDFSDHKVASFIGRPASLDELDSHLGRLSHWGFNCLRLLTTWEAVEHAGPGHYDEAYLDYYREVCRRAGDHGLRVFVDFHQDAWSRMTGGSGAPGWTFEAAGLDFTKFHASGAAHVMQYSYNSEIGGRQDSYPVMSWSGNYARPANGIMWTQFFAGEDFAPSASFGGMSVQAFLQTHYLGSMRAIAERVADLDNVIGFDTLNEPGTGYIGKGLTSPTVRYRGPIWTALDGLGIASGLPCELPIVAPGQGVVGTQRFNDQQISIWLPGREDPFRLAGAWEPQDGNPVALKDDYFQSVDGRPVDLANDYMAPFFARVAETVRAVRSDWLIFVETDPFETIKHGLPKDCPERSVNASHWYDLPALVTKSFSVERRNHVMTGQIQEGAQAIEDAYTTELGMIRSAGDNLRGGVPSLIGECGIQYDMNDGKAYEEWSKGNHNPEIWTAQTQALDLMYNALDRLLLSSTQWNYTVSNRNDPMVGDGWNQEDLSIWSADQASDADDPDAGGRALEGFCRPFIRAAQGTIVGQKFDRATGHFVATIDADSTLGQPTEIYVPHLHYPAGYELDVRGASEISREPQMLKIRATSPGTLIISLSRR